MTKLIVAVLVAFLGLFVRSFSGFGSALVMTPILLFFFDLRTTVVLIAIIEIPASFYITIHARKNISPYYLKMLVPLSLIGVAVGSFILTKYDSSLLKRVFGGFTLLFTLRIIIELHLANTEKRKWPRVVGFFTGIFGGTMSGMFGTAGPPVAIYLENQIKDKDTLRATMLTYFLINDGCRLIYYAFSRLITIEALKISAVMLPVSFIGAYLGKYTHLKISEYVFRLVISVVLFATGVLLVLGK